MQLKEKKRREKQIGNKKTKDMRARQKKSRITVFVGWNKKKENFYWIRLRGTQLKWAESEQQHNVSNERQ